MTLPDLIAKLEAASEGSRELDGQIALVLGLAPAGAQLHRSLDPARGWWVPGKGPFSGDFWLPPHYTTSINAALTLVPDGQAYAVLVYASAAIGEPPQFGDHEAPPPALALCIAALKARLDAEK